MKKTEKNILKADSAYTFFTRSSGINFPRRCKIDSISSIRARVSLVLNLSSGISIILPKSSHVIPTVSISPKPKISSVFSEVVLAIEKMTSSPP